MFAPAWHRMMLVSILATVDAWSNGGSDCPCIDLWSENLVLGDNTPIDQAVGCDIEYSVAAQHLCYPASYGNGGCAAYDSAGLGCNVAEPPVWCTLKWCYVDPSNCMRPHQSSTWFTSARLQTQNSSGSGCAPDRKITYSYQTCGDRDSFSASVEGAYSLLRTYAAQQPSGKLRVTLPGDSGSQYTLVGTRDYPGTGQRQGAKVEPFQGVGGTNRSGSVPVFMNNIFDRGNIPWEEVPLSAPSRAFSPRSSFSACVHDVHIGNTDMCWGNFWPTSARRELSTFTTSMYDDYFHVITFNTGADTGGVWASLMKPFEPFSASLWMVIIAVFGLVGVTMTCETRNKAATSWWDFVTKVMHALRPGLDRSLWPLKAHSLITLAETRTELELANHPSVTCCADHAHLLPQWAQRLQSGRDRN